MTRLGAQRLTREQELTRYYREHAPQLRLAVSRRVHSLDRSSIEDACQFAWTQLVRRPDIRLDRGGLHWLLTTATRHAWTMASHDRELPAGPISLAPDRPGELSEPAGDAADPFALAVAREQHDQHVRAFAQLATLERRELYLHALGYRYTDIARLTGSTYTAVNHRITKGRAKLRTLRPPGERL